MNDQLLDRCIAAIYDEGKSVDDCLAQHADERDTLEPLLRLTQRLQAAKSLQAPADFRMTARARLEKLIEQDQPAQAAVTTTVPTRSAARWSMLPQLASASNRPTRGAHPLKRPAVSRQTWSLAAALAILLVLLVANTTISLANQSLPGDALFPVKTASENVMLFLAPSPKADADLRIQYVERRLQELKRVAKTGQFNQFRQAVDRYDHEITSLAAYVINNESAIEERVQVAEQLANKLALHEQEFASLADEWPPQQALMSQQEAATAREDFFRLRDVLQDLYSTLREEVPGWQPLLPTLPPALTQVAPGLNWLTATPSPEPDLEQFLSTTAPCLPDGTCWESKWPTTEPGKWPTPWPTWWSTQVSETREVPIPPYLETLIPQYWPTFLPTELPDPTGIPGDMEDELPPDLPPDFPGDTEDELPPDLPPDFPGDTDDELPPDLPPDFPGDMDDERPPELPPDLPDSEWQPDFSDNPPVESPDDLEDEIPPDFPEEWLP